MQTAHTSSASHSSAYAGGSAESATGGGTVQSTVERLRGEVERLVETAMNSGEKALDAVGIKPPVRRPALPPVDLTDTPEAVVARVDLPGVKPGNVNVDLSGSILTVSGVLPAFPPEHGSTAVQTERPRGAFSRSISLPAAVDPGGVTAELRDGLLTVTLRKNVAATNHSIPVNAES